MNGEPPTQLSNNSRALVVSDLTHVGQNSPYMISRDNIQNGGLIQIAESTANHSKKLQDDMLELGQKIKHHEDNVKYLKHHKNKLDESVVDMQVTIGKYHMSSSMKKEDPSHNEEKIIQNILKHEGSAAALWYRMKSQPETQASYLTLTKDVLGIVATLGMVDDGNLSRLLSEYLGLDTMLALVCKTYEGVKALETYNRQGLIDKSLGLCALGVSGGRPLDGRFRIICLEKLRPYVGDFIDDDPQQRLDLLKPRLINGEIPPGFLGFAVNMITMDSTYLNGISSDGHNLRESLFYNLFSNLQVYRSREDMLKALPFISNGAVSLDGGVIKSPGVFDMGQKRGEMDVMFPNGSDRFNMPVNYFEIENRLKETEWEKTRTMGDLQIEQSLLDLARFNYEKKKQEFVQFLAQSSFFAAQHQA
ncbi:protein DEFECTIVE IN MERISTEM SILENCING 3-like isoform X1 [Primulina huaijiensis]|uniref:protein DEFECTIVE IN MERISTEM SILENCING 3-like isoform X1 n=2 Tax=Primulina huaijiensis TaxID=1492673 RepID=UPI003CC75FD1